MTIDTVDKLNTMIADKNARLAEQGRLQDAADLADNRTVAIAQPMVFGRLAIMGQVEVVEPDSPNQHYPMALLIEFDSVADIRRALNEGQCKFGFAT